MNKVFVLKPNEDWIVDRLVKEWYEDNADISVRRPEDADVIWILSEWCYRHLDRQLLQSKKVITTIHHIVEEKFDAMAMLEFRDRDALTTLYHVPNEHTATFVSRFTSKPVHIIPYWANQKIWKKTGEKRAFRDKYGIPANAYVVGSFQRDTEGRDLKSPKLEKGPDLLADYLDALNSFISSEWNNSNPGKLLPLHVLLSGWRRQYIIGRLEQSKIPYTYIELPSQETINELYQTLDLYPVTSRCEGGPQSLIECGLLNIPVISRDIGVARTVLPPDSINNNVALAQPNIPNVMSLMLPEGYRKFRDLIQQL